MSNFSARLKMLRKADHITQADLAEEFYLKNNTVSSWETGRTQPNIGQLIALSYFFGVTVGQLVGTEDLVREVDDDY